MNLEKFQHAMNILGQEAKDQLTITLRKHLLTLGDKRILSLINVTFIDMMESYLEIREASGKQVASNYFIENFPHFKLLVEHSIQLNKIFREIDNEINNFEKFSSN